MQHDLYLDKNLVLKLIKQSKPSLKKANKPNVLRFIDLFSGCGGLSYGLHMAAIEKGFKAICALAIDINDQALSVYKDNIPYEKDAVVNKDILELFNKRLSGRLTKQEELLKTQVGKVDFLVAGPPCQGHSDLNNSTRRNDPRNKLYLASIRAVELFSPSLVIIENVPTVVHSEEQVIQLSERRLIKLGYHINSLMVNFLNFGIPQSRKRHIIIATRKNDFSTRLCVSKHSTEAPVLKEFFEDIKPKNNLMDVSGRLSDENQKRVEYLFANKLYNLPNELRPACHKDKAHSYNSVYGRLDFNLPAQTLTSGYGSMGQGRYIHPSKKRTINSSEASRIQGFPDSYDFSKVNKITELRQMIANAVPPQLTYAISSLYIEHEIENKKTR